MVADLAVGPFGACIAVAEHETYDKAVFTRWLEWLCPYWGTALIQHALEREGERSIVRARRAVERVDDDRVDGSVLALLFGQYRNLATLPDLRCSTLTRPTETPPKRVLVALSRPDHRSQTLRAAAWIAAKTNARLFGVHVVATDDESAHPGGAIVANAKALALGIARTSIEEVSVAVSADVPSAIERCARQFDADLVIVGARRSNRGPVTCTIAANDSRATLVVADPRMPGGKN